MKKIIKITLSIISTIISIAIMIVFGLIVYTEINKEDEKALQILQDGYAKVKEIIYGKEEDNGELDKPQKLDEIIANSGEINRYYYYEQLENYSKIIYNKLLENKENMKTGTYTINFGKTFNKLLEEEGGEEKLQGYYQAAIETYSYDNPEIFYLNPKNMYINIQTTTSKFETKYEVFLNSNKEANYLAKGYNTKEEVDIAEQEIKKVRDEVIASIENKSEYEKIKMIHDYLVDQITYDQSVSKNNIYNIYGALVKKECVCEGYARSYKYLLDEAKIENVIVIGEGRNSNNETESHAWNYVKLDGAWYAVDVTWDDPVMKGPAYISNKARYKYFLLGSKEISKDHILSSQFIEGGKEYIFPELSEENYKQ